MNKQSIVHDTFVIKRRYSVAMARVYAYLSEPQKKRRWYAADSETSTVEDVEMDFRVGGIERASVRLNERTPFPGALLTNQGTYQDIVPGQRIVLATSMTLAERRVSCSLITFEVAEADGETELVLTHQGVFFDGSGGPKMRKDGWEVLLNRLDVALKDDACA